MIDEIKKLSKTSVNKNCINGRLHFVMKWMRRLKLQYINQSLLQTIESNVSH